MAIDKITPRFLNADSDKRTVERTDLTSAYNISISESGEGTATVINNAMGNEAILAATANDQMEGRHQVIGQVADPQRGRVYFAVVGTGPGAIDSIYYVDVNQGSYRSVLRDNRLNFTPSSFVKMDVINNVGQNDQTILYFTDNINPPRKINVDRALFGNYSSLSLEEFNYTVNTIKAAPVYSPTSFFDTDNAIPHNNFKKDVYQFATQLIYRDGEESAISPYSELLIPAHVTLANNEGQDFVFSDLANNVAKINLNLIEDLRDLNDVFEVRLLGKIGNEGTFYIIDQFRPSTAKFANVFGQENVQVYNPSSQIYSFYNDTLGAFIPDFVVNKLYDNVPFRAEGQAIVGNRLMYSNYTEGRQNNPVRASITPVYKGINDVIFDRPYNELIPYLTPIGDDITIDFLSIFQDSGAPVVPAGASFNFRFQFYPEPLSFSGTFDGAVDFELEIFSNSLIGEQVPSSVQVDFSNGEIEPTSSYQSSVIDFNVQSATQQTALAMASQISNEISLQSVVVRYSVEPAILQGPGGFQYNLIINTDSGDYYLSVDEIDVEWGFESVLNLELGLVTISPYVKKITPASSSLIVAEINNSTLDLSSSIEELSVSFTPIQSESLFPLQPLNAGYNEFRAILTDQTSKGFKAGSLYRFGVVYYDEYNRSGFVNEIGSGYVGWYNNEDRRTAPGSELTTENSSFGPASFRINFSQQPVPSWAKTYQIVTPGSATVADFVQYTVGGAFLKRKGEIDSASTRPLDEESKQIYISLDTLTKYRSDRSTFREYSFTEGDKLRVVSRRSNLGTITLEEDDLVTVFPGASDGTIIEFDVVGVELLDRIDTNPIAFRKDSSGNDIPMSLNTIPKEHLGTFVVVENPKIISGSLGTDGEQIKYVGFDWYHLANTPKFGYQVSGTLVEYEYPDGTSATDTVHWYKNVVVEIYTPRPNLHDEFWYEISEVKAVGSEAVLVSGNGGPGSEFVFTGEHGLPITTNNGDVHYRPVPCFSPTYAELDTSPDEYDWFWETIDFTPGVTATNKDSWSYRSFYLESFTPSDIIGEKMWDRGRAHVKFENAKTFSRFNQITYSDAYSEDSRYLPLSSFNPTLANFYSLESKYGAARFIENYGMTGELLALQENKLSITPVNKSILEDASGQQNLALSTSVLNSTRYFVGDFGCSNHPEAVLVQDNDVYFVDASRKKVMRFAGGQLVPISDKSMSSVFEQCFDSQRSYLDTQTNKILSGYDPSIETYYVTFLDGRVINWNGNDTTQNIPNSSKIPLLSSGELRDGATFSYDVANGRWVSRHFFVPEIYSHVDNTMYTCRYVDNVTTNPVLENGQDFWVFRHSLDAPRCRYYFTNSGVQLSCVSNQNPSMSKTFDAVSIEGDGNFSSARSVATTNQGVQSGLAPSFIEKEGVWYARTGRDISTNSTSQYKALGVVSEVDGIIVTLSNDISYMSIARYNSVFYLNNGILESITGDSSVEAQVVSVSNPNRIRLNNPATENSIGGILIIQSDPSINGDAVRGQWGEILITQGSTQSPLTIFAVNSHITPSKYDHS